MQPWAVESEAQLAGLLASEADRGDELSAEVARAGKAAARWERKYAAFKEGVGTLVSSIRDERARVRVELAAMESSLANIPAMRGTVTSERGSLARELEELRGSIRNQYEHLAVLGTNYLDCDQAAVREFAPPSGTGEDEREEESDDEDGDGDEDEGDSRGEESDGSAEWLRGDELINFAKPDSAVGAAPQSASDTPPEPPPGTASSAPPGFEPAAGLSSAPYFFLGARPMMMQPASCPRRLLAPPPRARRPTLALRARATRDLRSTWASSHVGRSLGGLLTRVPTMPRALSKLA